MFIHIREILIKEKERERDGERKQEKESLNHLELA